MRFSSILTGEGIVASYTLLFRLLTSLLTSPGPPINATDTSAAVITAAACRLINS